MRTLEEEFPEGGKLKYLLLDACYDEDDDKEKDCFVLAMKDLWDLLKSSKELPTTKVREVETESKTLKRMMDDKDKQLKEMKDMR